MTIWNLGSINADYIYAVPRIPAPGETLGASGMRRFLGGKGTNMSVAGARAGARVAHIGAVGADGRWAIDRLMEYGVDTRHIAQVDTATGHAMILVTPDGENAIVLHGGANRALSRDTMQQALSQAETGDWLLLQNETNLQEEAAQLGAKLGLRIAYAAAPFDAQQVQRLLPYLDFLILNEVEAAQLRDATGQAPEDLPVRDVVVTKGAAGATWFGPDGAVDVAAPRVTPVDTTGAGDTFTGYVLAGLDRGQPMAQALDVASSAAALMVTREGTADVIPDLKEVQAFGA